MEPMSLDHTEEDLEQLKLQIDAMNEKYEVLRNLVQSENLLKADSNTLNGELQQIAISQHILVEHSHLKSQLLQSRQLNAVLIEEVSNLKSKLLLKDEEIQRLKSENLELIEEGTDIDYQTKSLFRGGASVQNSRYAVNNFTKAESVLSKRGNRESMSSTTSTNFSLPWYSDNDKLQKEKANIESQLVVYKLKYAEQSSKVLELEDERDSYLKKVDALSEKTKIKDEIIKSLISERDSLKYTSARPSNSRNTIRMTGLMTERGDSVIKTSSHWSACNSPERNTDYIKANESKTAISAKKTRNNLVLNTEYNDQVTINTGIPPGTTKNSSGFVKILKNIFTGEKK